MKSSRQKIKEHKRKSYLKIFLFFVLIVVLVKFKYFFAYTSLAIGELETNPQLNLLTRQDIFLILNIQEPVNILALDRVAMRQKLLQDLRVKTADVQYALPLKVVINIEENSPLVCLVSKYAFFEVDENNTILKVSRGITNPHIPILSGISVESSFVGDKVQSLPAQNVILFLKGLDEQSRAIISEINLKNNIVEILTLDRLRVIIGIPENIAAKSSDFNIVMKQIREQNLAVEYVNLSYERPFIKIKRDDTQQNKI